MKIKETLERFEKIMKKVRGEYKGKYLLGVKSWERNSEGSPIKQRLEFVICEENYQPLINKTKAWNMLTCIK